MNAPPFFFDIEPAERDARRSAEALADGLAGVVRVAHSLVRNGSRVDLTGLDRLFGLLCARALDLRPDHGRCLTTRLLALRDDLDALSIALAPREFN
jgi:hypothetical protein